MAKIIFAGSPDFVLPYLNWLKNSNHELVAIYTQPDRATGRGQKIQPNPVKEWGQQHCIPVEQPAKWHDAEINKLKQYQADILLVVAYGMLLPQAVLQTPKIDCLNIHYSLLPRWRGAAPVIHAMLHGDKQTGVCLMRMVQKLDAGPVYATATIDLPQHSNAKKLTEQLTTSGVTLLHNNLQKIIDKTITATNQGEAEICYAHKIKKNMAAIDWQESSTKIYRKIMAFNPWPICEAKFNGSTLRIGSATISHELENNPQHSNLTPGCITSIDNGKINVLCGDKKQLSIETVQMPGKKMQPAKDFLNSQAKNIEIYKTNLKI